MSHQTTKEEAALNAAYDTHDEATQTAIQKTFLDRLSAMTTEDVDKGLKIEDLAHMSNNNAQDLLEFHEEEGRYEWQIQAEEDFGNRYAAKIELLLDSVFNKVRNDMTNDPVTKAMGLVAERELIPLFECVAIDFLKETSNSIDSRINQEKALTQPEVTSEQNGVAE